MKSKAFQKRYGPWALVVGAAQGIGRAFARELDARGLRLLLVDRDRRGVEDLASHLTQPHRILPLDLAEEDSHGRLAAASADLDLGLLIFNAAHSRVGPFLDTPVEDHIRCVEVNARSVVACAHSLLPRLLSRGRGGLLLMSSLAAVGGTALVASYAATKAFDLVLAESLWAETRGSGVDVLALVAGPTDTPGFRASRARMAARLIMTPEAVAREGLEHLHRGPVHVCGRINRLTASVRQRLVPRGMAAAWMGRTMEQVYKDR